MSIFAPLAECKLRGVLCYVAWLRLNPSNLKRVMPAQGR